MSSYSQYLYTVAMCWNEPWVFKEKIEMKLGLIYSLHCFNFDMFFYVKYKEQESVLSSKHVSAMCFCLCFSWIWEMWNFEVLFSKTIWKIALLLNCRRNVYDLFCGKYQETRKVSLLWYQTPGGLLKNEAISEFFSMSFEIV